jgi:hypothetical protein
MSFSISAGDLYTFEITLFLIDLALEANLRVVIDSSRWELSLLDVHSKVVFELPPRDSFKNLVSIESLNGT